MYICPFRVKTGALNVMTKQRSLASLITLVLLSFASLNTHAQIPTDDASIKAGEALFKANCRSCHAVDRKLIGPALAGVESRVPSMTWLHDWVRNSAKVIASGDEYANKIYNEYNKSQMTAFTALKDEDINNIIGYVNAEANKPKVDPAAAAGGTGGTQQGFPQEYLYAILGGMILILILLLVVLGIIANALKNFLGQRQLTEADAQIVNSPYTVKSIASSPGFIFVVVFVVSAIAFKTLIDGLYAVGVQKDYQPRQPIAFSHKIHAGDFEIDCKYCHTGAMKGKQANIPSPNMCMNCHSQIRSGTNTGEGEIAKIYSAVGFDPATSTYTGKIRPIEWVRIHNLPDLAYFNHSQHVNVAGVECQTCHGPVQTMEVVKQHTVLTMGWCIDCHRKTDVTTKGNAYYDKLEQLHKDSKRNMKVEDIGGLECGKCHY
jgi:mono/diheme cytochrome c family protein